METSFSELFKSVILGLVQGLTEFLPVSSSGHLALVLYLFNWKYIPLYFTTTLHFATLLSVTVIFFKEILKIFSVFFKGLFLKSFRKEKFFKLSLFIIIGTIPAALAGFFLENHVEKIFSKPLYVSIFLIITGLILLLGEFYGNKNQKKFIKVDSVEFNNGTVFDFENLKNKNINKQHTFDSNKNKEVDFFIKNKLKIKSKNLFFGNLNWLNAFFIGIGQAIAILPGISRSGTTISFARFFGLKREECVKYSFLLSIPVIFGAFLLEVLNFFKSNNSGFNENIPIINIIVSFIFSFVSGFIAIKFLLNLVRRKNLNYFAIYCIGIAIIFIIIIIIKK